MPGGVKHFLTGICIWGRAVGGWPQSTLPGETPGSLISFALTVTAMRDAPKGSPSTYSSLGALPPAELTWKTSFHRRDPSLNTTAGRFSSAGDACGGRETGPSGSRHCPLHTQPPCVYFGAATCPQAEFPAEGTGGQAALSSAQPCPCPWPWAQRESRTPPARLAQQGPRASQRRQGGQRDVSGPQSFWRSLPG